jgi:hypothetical protein
VLFASSFGGPRLPLTSSSRGHADPHWKPAENIQSAKTGADLPPVYNDRLDSWEDFDVRDPSVWTEYPSEFDTSELESEILKMKEDKNYKSSKKRSMGTYKRVEPGSEVSSVTSEQDEVVVDAKVVYPPPGAKAASESRGEEEEEEGSYESYEDEEEEGSYYSTSTTDSAPKNARIAVAQKKPASETSTGSYEYEDEDEYEDEYESQPSSTAPAPTKNNSVKIAAVETESSPEYTEEFETEFEVSTVTETE